jgi:hypothetical protein
MTRLAALDWRTAFDWSGEAQDERARLAAECIGWEAVRSPIRDDGHFGGWQLRIPAYVVAHGLASDAVLTGHGFELDVWDVKACRDEIAPPDDDDEVTARLDLLHSINTGRCPCSRGRPLSFRASRWRGASGGTTQ